MRALAPFVLLSCWLSLPLEAAEAESWLDRLAAAEQQQSFQGAFIYERNGSFSSHGIWHAASTEGSRERVLQLDGEPHELVLEKGRVLCQSPSQGGLPIQSSLNLSAGIDAAKLGAVYELQVLGPSRVAGRDAVALALLPRDRHRYGMELHLDTETGLLLKSLLISEQGQLLERFQFIAMHPLLQLDERALLPVTDCQQASASAALVQVDSVWQPEWLPPGFTLAGVQESRSLTSDVVVQSMLFNDGLAHFSVFIEPLAGVEVDDVRSQLGPTVVVSRRVVSAEGDVMITVVGEIPLGTAEQVVLSMRAGDMSGATP